MANVILRFLYRNHPKAQRQGRAMELLRLAEQRAERR